jgi:hypothetical protein
VRLLRGEHANQQGRIIGRDRRTYLMRLDTGGTSGWVRADAFEEARRDE